MASSSRGFHIQVPGEFFFGVFHFSREIASGSIYIIKKFKCLETWYIGGCQNPGSKCAKDLFIFMKGTLLTFTIRCEPVFGQGRHDIDTLNKSQFELLSFFVLQYQILSK